MSKIPAAWLEAKVSFGDQKEDTTTLTANWWDELSDTSKEEYVQEHPNSKYAEMHKKAKEGKESTPVEHKENKEQKPAQTEEHSNGPVAVLPHPGHEAVAVMHKAAASPEMKPNSPLRKKIGGFLVTKAKNVVSHLKHEGKEFKVAGSACIKLAKRKPLDEHDKHALAAVAADLAAVAIAIATGGHLAHLLEEGAAILMGHAVQHLALESITKAAVKGAIHHATVLSSESVIAVDMNFDATLEEAVKILAQQLETADLSSLIPENEDDKTSENKVTARVNMSAEVAGAGLCPECRTPMKVTSTASGKMWTCATDRIAIPMPNGHN